ncbi:hypothetical protein BSKO_06341 [Bryopsis sp. KO-2023]|nr:hypothetical protein BSKO_06341 [Bryopsis sp. KO-2023]
MANEKDGDNNNNRIPSLQTVCLRVILKRLINVASVVDVMRYFEKIDWMIEQGPLLRNNCTAFMLRAYESIKLRNGEEAIREVMKNDLVDAMEEVARERDECVRKLKIVGKVVERPSAKPAVNLEASVKREKQEGEPMCERRLIRSVSGKSAFPYHCLTAGYKWPSEVNPASREEHLSAGEFQKIFGVSFKEYQGFPGWKRLRLKKDKMLF